MFNIKKLISFLLSLTLIFNIFVSTSAFALDLYDNCSQINDPNVYCRSCFYYNCRENEKDILNSGKDYVLINKHGSVTNNVDHYFSFKNLDRIFDMFKIEPTDQFKTKSHNLETESERHSLNFKNILKISFSTLLGALGGHFIGILLNKNKPKIKSVRTNGGNNRVHVRKSTFADRAYLIGAGVAGITSLIYFNVKKNLADDRISKERHKNYENWKKVYKLNDEKSFLLNLILEDLEKSNYYSNGTEKDAFLIGKKKKRYTFGSCLLGLTYTEEEKATLPERLKDLASKIRKNLEEHNMLDDDNKNDEGNNDEL